jgi:hypothetical protein
MNDPRRMMKAVKRLARRMEPLLASKPPELQGAVLADLVATWLVSFPNQMRADLLAMHMRYVIEFIPVNEHIAYGDAGHPQNAMPLRDSDDSLH